MEHGGEVAERDGLGDLGEGVEQRAARPSWIMNIRVGKEGASSVSSARSPMPGAGRKDMNAL